MIYLDLFRFVQSRAFVLLATFAVLCSVMLFVLPGCQLDVSGAIGAKAFYPDNVGDKKVGDPRKPMYEGSGYSERHTSGGESRSEGFPGMSGDK